MSALLPQRRTLIWIGLAALVTALLWLLGPVLTPFVVGAVLAYVLQPAVEALCARRVPRLAAVLLVECLAILAVLLLVFSLLPVLARELPVLREQIPLLAQRINQHLVPWLASIGVDFTLDVAGVKAFVSSAFGTGLDEWAGTLLRSAQIGGSFLIAVIGNAVLMPVVLFYLLKDWPKLVARAQALVPPRLRESALGFLKESDALLGQYLRGQLLVMGVLVVYYSVALALFGFELALPIGVFTGLAVFIPYLGFGLGLVLALLAALLQFGSWAGIAAVAVVYGVGQLGESFVLTPRLVGERIGLSPLMVIFVLLAFGHLFGFIGVLVALPVGAVAWVALGRAHRAYVSSGLFRG